MLDGVDNFIYLFSGGKDATVGLDLLQRYVFEYNIDIDVDVIMVTYPRHVYFMEDGNPSKRYTDTLNYWRNRNINIKVYSPDIADFTNNDPMACKTCKNTRKSYVDPYIESYKKRYESKTVGVVTGYTLYDALAYMDEILLVSNFQYNNILKSNDVNIQNRILNCLHKMKAKEELPNGLVVIRPLIDMHENKVVDYISSEGIPYVSNPCKAAKDKHKREYFKALNTVAKINNADYDGLLNFLKTLNIEFPNTFDDIQVKNYFTDC
jgi:tRNA(Ile)-lysidine synthase TilS/MesJ